uniref:Uncharacterized protein n=1 Tax=Elaeophora elaphi TaxID=1147741 RepID=A0A0R3RML7_9BILA
MIAANTTSPNPLGLYDLSTYQRQQVTTTVNHELHSNNCITTASSNNSFSSTASSFTTQRPQAIVTPMTATVTINEPITTVNQESKTKKTDDNKRQHNGMIPDIKNNNTLEKEEQKLNNQHCIQCSTAGSQRTIISNNSSIGINSISSTYTTSSTNIATSCDSSNFKNVLDHHVTTMIDESQSIIINSDLIKVKKIETTNVNDQEFPSFLTISDHSIISSTKSQNGLSPVIEDSNSSGNNSCLTTHSVSTIASISSSAGNISASETAVHSIASSDAVSSSIITSSHTLSTKNERTISSSKSTTSTSRSSTTAQPLSNRTATDKRHSVSTRLTNSRTIESLAS